ncbi:hypothetical protein ACFSTD_14835 [Novosphingobium colocasiae]|uniref:Cell wall hydrolase n=1 Tax=Novosphingobium colocasiae TaxID=1256513 RepID=A0A918UGT0_9SPHN|nr:hypothetical protein [Novosphingobium colocasiae]GGZ09744.1 hypothetical protein GCM10011614_25910 [Novosphingobium colocasiae]
MRKPTPFGVAARAAFTAFALASAAAPQLARADDPTDPAMRNQAAREADRETIRRMNEAQLATVRDRDAGYASGWRAYDATRGRAEYEATSPPPAHDSGYRATRAEADYADARREYDEAVAQWRRDVAACRAGYTEYCAR